jgi:hypothetical protein
MTTAREGVSKVKILKVCYVIMRMSESWNAKERGGSEKTVRFTRENKE